ncbi:MAG: polysaccharide export protein [Nitrospirae bacterium]|nr:MAG: polysaccharide export protein [Nitrospirota bacterium]
MKKNRCYGIVALLCSLILTGQVYAQEIQSTQGLSGSPSQQLSSPQSLQQPVNQPLQQLILQQPVKAVEHKTVPDRTSSGFEQYVAGTASLALSTDIRQFGYDLFEKPPSTFAPVTSVPVGPDYVLGPGDEIRITVWGKIDGTWNVVVDRDGSISLPKIGMLGVTGLTFQELKGLLQKEFSKYFTGFEMNVSMGPLRTMRVYIVGNAQRPGAYTVSSLSTIINAVFEAGGPAKTGSLRDLQVKRNGRTVGHFDMYDFLLKGDKAQDIRLMPEDVIFIPPVGPLVGIAGNVNTPAIYELKGETRLLDLIRTAGGLTGIAFKGRVQVQRIESHQFRTIFEGDLIDMDKNVAKNFLLQSGDLVKVFSVVEAKNTVTLTGAVSYPGDYGVTAGVTKVKDIIQLAGGLLYYAANQAEVTRVTVTGAGPVTEVFPIDLSRALEGDPQHNVAMKVNDYIFVRTVPEWDLYRLVSISGEVKYPGVYTIRKGEVLSSLIERAGGYTDKAYLKGAIFRRESVRALQQKSHAEMIERLDRELFARGSAQASVASSQEEIQSKKVELEQKQKFVESLRSIKVTGRMTIGLSHLRLLKGSESDLELENNDSLFIPAKNNVVNVSGSVMSLGSFVYRSSLDYRDYVEMAGGYSDSADRSNVYVLKVDGSARKLTRGFMNWNSAKTRWEVSAYGDDVREIDPGDTIVVPEKLERIAWLREFKDITQILMQIAVAAGVVVNLF